MATSTVHQPAGVRQGSGVNVTTFGGVASGAARVVARDALGDTAPVTGVDPPTARRRRGVAGDAVTVQSVEVKNERVAVMQRGRAGAAELCRRRVARMVGEVGLFVDRQLAQVGLDV